MLGRTWRKLEMAIVNQRLASITALCREAAVPALVVALIALYGPAGNTAAAPVADRLTPPLSVTAGAKLADKLPSIALGAADLETARKSVTASQTDDATPAAQELKPVVTAALTDTSEVLRPETPPVQSLEVNVTGSIPGAAGSAIGAAEDTHECSDSCIDQYLWALYQRTPKEDSVKSEEQRKVTVKKKGKLVTITRTFTRLADEDFSWKDPKAAENAVMEIADYVIGGVDRDFKLKLFHMLHAAEDAGLSPGITSAFRDDYRQSIASGLKAANNRSYHGGSLRGGYGHGLAADIVSVKGATRAERLNSSQVLWSWVDKHGPEFGIARPYLGRDPPHVAPIDGKEIADHRPGMKTRQVASAAPRQ
jgi:hypothetical protein